MRYEPENDLYDAMGIDSAASQPEVDAAVHARAARTLAASETLMNPELRREYDAARLDYRQRVLRSRGARTADRRAAHAIAGARGAADVLPLVLAAAAVVGLIYVCSR